MRFMKENTTDWFVDGKAPKILRVKLDEDLTDTFLRKGNIAEQFPLRFCLDGHR